ncbi:hypothetical protein FA15DRAFT_703346 [Coprinopsis marcescibilis]|uniref:Transmembrane protein n=1 Tax=Coprinopsis marcescibilis TaxID=230819 RepID=A0A5C3KZP0_COPMA|nr:hypothetical protein FA15DRAFT_703346 [Coprinopsis marcescibilis]
MESPSQSSSRPHRPDSNTDREKEKERDDNNNDKHRDNDHSPTYPAQAERPASGSASSPSPVFPPSASGSPHPPSSFPYPYAGAAGTVASRADAPSRASYKSEGYPSWLPRRPPPPAPASTVGTNTPMPTNEFGILSGSASAAGTTNPGEFEREYKAFLEQMQRERLELDADQERQRRQRDMRDISMDMEDTDGNNLRLDTTMDNDDNEDDDEDNDYLEDNDDSYLQNPLARRPRNSTGTEGSTSSPDPIPPTQIGGRKATPRSVRIVNLQRDAVAKGLGVGLPPAAAVRHSAASEDLTGAAAGSPTAYGFGDLHARTHSQSQWYSRKHQHRESNHEKRISSGATAVAPVHQAHTRAYSRGAAPPAFFNSVASAGGISMGAGGAGDAGERRTRPKFNLRGLHLEMMRSPSGWMKVYYRLWPILVFAHIPVQTFLDFNAVYMLVQVSRHPLPNASPNSGKNWALCAAAYIACWFLWALVVFLLYEVVYNFARRWRVRRPLIFPLYLNASGYTYACLTSYNTFCFLQHLRYTAFLPIEPDLSGVTSSNSSRISIEYNEKSEAEANQDDSRDTNREGDVSGVLADISGNTGYGAGDESKEKSRSDEVVEEPRTPVNGVSVSRPLPAARNHGRTESQESTGSEPDGEGDAALSKFRRREARERGESVPVEAEHGSGNGDSKKTKSGLVLFILRKLQLHKLLGYSSPSPSLSPSADVQRTGSLRTTKKFTKEGAEANKVKRLEREKKVKQSVNVTWRDGLAETFNLYSQNLPNMVVLLPRAGVALGLVLAFGSGAGGGRFGTSLGQAAQRDATFFRRENGLLTEYALAILWINIAWAGWRLLVLVVSWIGLWILSGHSCAGICGPRNKWEEEEHNRLSAAFSPTHHGRNYSISSSLASDDDSVLPWEWRECTRARVQDAWEFCLVGRMGLRWGVDEKRGTFDGARGFGGEEFREKGKARARVRQSEKGYLDRERDLVEEDEEDDGGLSDEGLQRVLAAVGFPSVASPAKRGVLRSDLFESPSKGRGSSDREKSGDNESLESLKLGEKRKGYTPPLTLPVGGQPPLLKLPYPFTKPGSGQVSSKDLVPFPKERDRDSGKSGSKKSKSKSQSGTSSGTGSGSGSSNDDDDDRDGEGQDQDEEEEEEDGSSSSHRYSAEPSTPSHSHSSSSRGGGGGRASNSMSSLGHPLPPAASSFGGVLAGSPTGRSISTFNPPSASPVSPSSGSGSGSGGSGARPLSISQSSASPVGWKNRGAGVMGAGAAGGVGSTRFPFLSGPPGFAHPAHQRRPGAHSTTSSTGHSRGLSQVSGVSGFSGFSAISAGSGYAASGSAGPGLSEGAESVLSGVRSRMESAESGESGSSGEDLGGGGRPVVPAGGLPMPPRHPHLVQQGVQGELGQMGVQGRSRRGSRVSGSPKSGSGSSSTGGSAAAVAAATAGVVVPVREQSQLEGVAFPSVSEREGRGRGRLDGTFPEDVELGLGALARESGVRTSRTRRMGEEDGASLQLELQHGDEEDSDYNDDDEHDEEVKGEREDVVGLLGSGSASGNNSAGPSPRASLVDITAAGARSRTRSRHSSSAQSRESLRLSTGAGARPLSISFTGDRSRRSSLRQGYTVTGDSPARSRRESVASAVRERASSFGVMMRERAQSLMQSVVGAGVLGAGAPGLTQPVSTGGGQMGPSSSMTNLHAGHGHRRLGSSSGESAAGVESRVTGSIRSATPAVVRLSGGGDGDAVIRIPVGAGSIVPTPVMRSVSGDSSGSSSSGGVQRHHQLIEEDASYSSSSHSRSGSESLSGSGSAPEGNNHTFGRPVPFLQTPSDQEDESDFGEPISPQRRLSPALQAAAQSSEDEEEQYFSQPEASLRSPQLSVRTRTGSATPSMLSSGMPTPIPLSHEPTFVSQQQGSESPALQDSPPEVFLHPPSAPGTFDSRWARNRSLSPAGSTNTDYLSVRGGEAESIMMLSSAAQSFVTAPASIAESSTTTTTGRSGGSSDTATISGSWEERGAFFSGFLGPSAATRTGLGTQRGRRDSGMVERAGDVAGAGGGIGDGRIA